MRLNMVFGTDLNGDGEFGPITRDAVVAFQAQEQIGQTGVVDAEHVGAAVRPDLMSYSDNIWHKSRYYLEPEIPPCQWDGPRLI